jgi:methyl coenzyme M reductase system subunit A2
MDKPFITVSGVSKEFEGEEVLRDVSVEIREGESLGLLGRSGSGKSVLLHMLQRTFGLYGDDTLMYNVLQSLERIGYPSERWFRRAYELLKSVKMLHRISFPAAYLSGGEKQRVVLARQLALDPMLLLADEPTGTLDFETAKLVHKALIDSTRGRMTMIVTSHWPYVIEELTEKSLWLEHGEIVEYGDSKTVVEDFKNQVGGIPHAEYMKVGEPKIKVERCKKYYSQWGRLVKAVDDVSLTINENEIFGLLGRSGAGKTSLARIISQIDPLTGGSVKIRVGDRWIDVGEEVLKINVAMLHQEYSLYPEHTVLENLTGCIGLYIPEELARMKIKFILEGIGFSEEEAEGILHKTHTELSVGERHRVALAQILMKEPAIAILDEPTGTMDPITKNFVAYTIKSARANLGMTFLIVSHDVDFAYDVCDRVAHMEAGKITRIEDLRF